MHSKRSSAFLTPPLCPPAATCHSLDLCSQPATQSSRRAAAAAAAEGKSHVQGKSHLTRIHDTAHMQAMSDILRTNVEQAEAIQKAR